MEELNFRKITLAAMRKMTCMVGRGNAERLKWKQLQWQAMMKV